MVNLVDVGYLLTHKVGVLLAVLFVFLAIRLANVLFGRSLSTSKVNATIELAIIGLLLSPLETWLAASPEYARFAGDLQSLFVMACLANLAAYLVVDVYAYYRMKEGVPSFLRSLLTLLVYVAAAMVSLRIVFDVNLASILTTTTVLTAAVAFAMQNAIADAISGFYIQGDRNLKRKAWIHLKDKNVTGEIVNVGFRYTTLRQLNGSRALVPNGFIMRNIVHQLADGEKGGCAVIHCRIHLGYEVPPEKAMRLLRDALLQDDGILGDPAPSVRIDGFTDNSVEYDLKFFIEDYGTVLRVRSRVLGKIWYAVTREGYGFPYPRRELISMASESPFPSDVAEIFSRLRKAGIFESLSDGELGALADTARVRIYGPGEAVVKQGDGGDSLFIVTGGSLGVHVDGVRVGVLEEDDLFGEMSLLTGERRKATVTSESEAHLIEITKKEIEPIIKSEPLLLDRLSAVLARREEMNERHLKSLEPSQVSPGRKEAFARKLRSFFNLC